MSEGGEGTEPAAVGGDDDIAQRYRKVFEHSNDAILVVDIDAETFLDANPAACELLGYSREELLGMDPAAIHPDDIGRVRAEFVERVIEKGAGFTDDLTCLTRDGEEVLTEISAAALEPDAVDGRPTRMIAMLRDVSDRVERERQLEAKIERLDRFAGIVSHDLRNPLSVIRANAELVRESGDLERLGKIEKAVDRMDDMLSELLRLTREGGLVESQSEVDLAPVARETWDGIATGNATLTVESSVRFTADRERLRELLGNLFRNAIDHGTSPVAVRVGAVDREATTGFFVADDGPGIPEERHETVFEWGETTRRDGTGFGLAYVVTLRSPQRAQLDPVKPSLCPEQLA